MPSRLVWTALFVVIVLLAASPGRAGFTGTLGMGVALTADEAVRVETAIDFIEKIANLPETTAKNREVLLRIAECLRKMLADGKICREGAANKTWQGLCSNDLKKSWRGDAINICGELLGSGEVIRRVLTAVLVHEGLHALQCSQDANRREWSAYAWEIYVLEKWQSDAFPPIPLGESRAAFKRQIAAKKAKRDAFCQAAQAATPQGQKKKLSTRPQDGTSAVDPARTWTTHLGGEEVVELHETYGGPDDGTPLRTIASGFPVVTAIEVGLTADEREVLYMCGTDPEGVAGGLERFVDLDGDGLVDQLGREELMPLGALALPLDMALDALTGRLYVLDVQDEQTAVRLLVDDDGDGIPELPLPDDFASSSAFPELFDTRMVRAEAPGIIRMSSFIKGQSFITPTWPFHDAIDPDLDGTAAIVETFMHIEDLQPQRPVFLGDVQAGDTSVRVHAAPGGALEIWTSTEDGGLLDLLGAGPASNELWEQEIPLEQSLAEDAFLVAIAADQPVPPGPPTPVAPMRPEIIDQPLEEVLAGEPVTLFGRGFGDAPAVLCAGVPAKVIEVTDAALVFIAPEVEQDPTGNVTVEVIDPKGNVSLFFGLQINGDCNGNGLPDWDEIAAGMLVDADADNVPDACESPCPDTNGDGSVDVQDLVVVIVDWNQTGSAADVNADGTVNVLDLIEVILGWGACDPA